MNSSPRRSLAQPEAASSSQPQPEISAFPYPELGTAATPRGLGSFSLADAAADESAARENSARESGRHQGQSEARRVFDEQLGKERSMLIAALTEFARDRNAYYQQVEAEVVQLALGIARKIMHRESQLDPLLLAGIVRVALGKIEGATSITLRVHPQHAAEWRRFLTEHLEPAHLPEIVEDPALPPDQCLLETSMGKAELGVEIQLKEIERGLLDLLAARPREKA